MSKLAVVAILGLILSVSLIFREDSSGSLNPEDKRFFSSVPDIAAPSETTVHDFIINQSEDHSMRWFFSDTPRMAQGRCLGDSRS